MTQAQLFAFYIAVDVVYRVVFNSCPGNICPALNICSIKSFNCEFALGKAYYSGKGEVGDYI